MILKKITPILVLSISILFLCVNAYADITPIKEEIYKEKYYASVDKAQIIDTEENENQLNAYVIGRASVQFEGCNNINELISSDLTVVLLNSLKNENKPVEKVISAVTDEEGFFVAKLDYPRVLIKDIKYKNFWQIPMTGENSAQITFDVLHHGLCKAQDTNVLFMDISPSVNSDCMTKHTLKIFLKPNNEVAELLFYAILVLKNKDDLLEHIKQCQQLIESKSK